MKKNRSLLVLLTCLIMIFNICPTTFASTETIGADMLWASDFTQTEWATVDENSKIFDETAFEPGDEVIRYFDIQNTGDLAIYYVLDFIISEGADTYLASAIDVYVKNDVTGNVSISDMGSSIGTLSEVLADKTISTGKITPVGEAATEGFTAQSRKVAVALKLQETTEYFGKSLNGFKLQLTANETDYDYTKTEKFVTKFPNTDTYLYRVGNENTVALGSLFANDNAIGYVNVTVESISGTALGTYTANASDWTKGTIQFAGTGSVKVTITDDGRKTAPTTLYLEVVDGKNATSAANATANNVVLLNDVGFSTIEVSGGHTLYGNGFTMTCTNDYHSQTMDSSFVALDNGTLDNVKVIVPNFSHSILYDSNKKDEANPYIQPGGTTEVNDRYFYNIRSAVIMKGTSNIVNSYISGGRAAIYAMSGVHTIDNSTIYGGATANIHISSANSLTLKDATLIQKPIQATVHDTTKTVMGLSVIAACDGSTGEATPITLEGELVQYAWGYEGYSQYVPSDGQDFISAAFDKADFLHPITYEDGETRDSLNLGIFYLPATVGSGVIQPTNITDNRTNKSTVPYEAVKVSVNIASAYVYSYKNTNGTIDAFKTEPSYSSDCQGNISVTVDYDDSADGDTFKTYFDETNGTMSKLTVDLDTVGTYDFKFSDLKVNKFGQELSYTVKDSSGNTIDKAQTITLTDSGVSNYILTITDNLSLDKNGQLVTDESTTYDYYFNITSTMTSIDPPTLVGNITNDEAYLIKSTQGWTCGLPASLDGINLKCYNKTSKAYETVNLGTAFPITSTGKLNETNNFWTKTNEDWGTLTVTCGLIHEGQGVYGMPIGLTVDSDKKLYFTISSTNGYVSTSTSSRIVTIDYKFEDKNGKTWTKSVTHTFNYADYNDDYKYTEFTKGNLESNCLAEGTLITLADGSQKAIEDLTYEDEILVWDFFKGEYTSTVPSLLINDGVDNYRVINLNFDDGSDLRVIYEHGLFDVDANDYVYINKENVADFVGHTFVTHNGTATLESYEITEEYIDCYTILTAFHNNCIANGLLTVTPPPIDGWYDYFEISEGMKYDEASMNADIEKYGLYTYEDFEQYISYEEYLAFNGAYLKILVGKGYFTFEDILEQIQVFGVGNGGNAVMPLNDETTSIVITSGENSIATATFGMTITAGDVTIENGSYTVPSKECVLNFTATGDASYRYAKLTVDSDVYYTAYLAENEETTVTIKNAANQAVSIEILYGKHNNNSTEVIDLGEFTYRIEGASVIFSNTTKYPVEGFDVWLAVYNSENQLLDAKKGNYTEIKAGKTDETFAPSLATTEGTIKAFIWKTGTMTPYFE